VLLLERLPVPVCESDWISVLKLLRAGRSAFS
jgi:hypothetical protein